ncbi:hypothetical protein [Hymenobacter terricola]|uniref:hypothetical protein n=1 Tax=Hymenobacter terricola TaxID=2819236 RepID=UPI001B30DCFB|nr:hypothetical protein [Hymenobacter terricola]
MVAMMLSGRKVLRWPERPTFALGPGVVFVPPVAEQLAVDLPEASFEPPRAAWRMWQDTSSSTSASHSQLRSWPAGMSNPNFFRCFKNEFGLSPGIH